MADQDDTGGLEQLLPFYVNRTLDPEMRARIDAALARSSELRAALAEQQEIAGMVKTGASAWQGGAEQAAVLTIAEPAAAPQPAKAGVLAFLSPANWRPAVALGLAVAVMAQGAGLVAQQVTIARLEEENYQLASGQDTPGRKGSILIELNDDARWSAVTALLAEEGLEIVASSDLGTLTLATDKTGAEREAVLARLRASPLVASAEPAA
ncbi:MAG TPA: hypothetical protein VFV30_12780 [Novosphingobium sp.]|nr:hypothetical protein [Novosphingobium sp.]